MKAHLSVRGIGRVEILGKKDPGATGKRQGAPERVVSLGEKMLALLAWSGPNLHAERLGFFVREPEARD